MTLDTSVYVHDEIDKMEVFHFCQSLLGVPVETQKWDDTDWYSDTDRCVSNKCGQGFPAWLMLKYNTEGPLRPDGDAHEDYCDDEDCTGQYHAPAHFLEVSFDTAYSYTDDKGGCGALHARIVAQLGRWLDERGIGWSWNNEFTGETHGGEDRYERLADLCESSARAQDWFQNIVTPAILSGMIK